jgi:hypothetical protein
MDKISLHFSGKILPCLDRVVFERDDKKILSVRGKTGGAYGNVGTFQWTSAVQALAMLMIRHRLQLESDGNGLPSGVIFGDENSPAASIDYALTKRPTWLMDMFGTEPNNRPYSAKLFHRTNPNRKRFGPVIICVNQALLKPLDVTVLVDEVEVQDITKLKTMLDVIGQLWFGRAVDALEAESLPKAA